MSKCVQKETKTHPKSAARPRKDPKWQPNKNLVRLCGPQQYIQYTKHTNYTKLTKITKITEITKNTKTDLCNLYILQNKKDMFLCDSRCSKVFKTFECILVFWVYFA